MTIIFNREYLISMFCYTRGLNCDVKSQLILIPPHQNILKSTLRPKEQCLTLNKIIYVS